MPSTWTRRKRLWMATVAGIVSFVVGAGLLLLLVAAVAAAVKAIGSVKYLLSALTEEQYLSKLDADIAALL